MAGDKKDATQVMPKQEKSVVIESKPKQEEILIHRHSESLKSFTLSNAFAVSLEITIQCC